MLRVGPLPPKQSARKASFRVKIIKLKPSTWWDAESCAAAIRKALRAKKGIDPESSLLYRGVSRDRKKLFLKYGTDHQSDATVMAVDKLHSHDMETDGALHYAFLQDKPMVAVYKELDAVDCDVYGLDMNHPTKGLLALIEL
jgi:hypothetical protein